jgi:ATP phosphoribosyltransferase regulatory subunit
MLRAVERTGLAEFVLDVGHAGVAAALLEPVPSAARPLLLEALNAKDRAALQRSVTALGLTRGEHLALAALTELQGEVCKDGVAFWRRAEAALGATAAAPYVNLLRTLVEGAAEAGLAPEIVVDLGEVRGYEYYSGVMFQVLAHGPGEPIASGGRYDTLYDRFGLPNTPAAGFAIDVHNLCWALEQGNVPDPGYPRLVAAGTLPDALLGQLRDLGVVCCGCETETDVAAYAEAYQFEFILSRTGDGLSVKHNRGEVVTVPDAGDAAQKVYEFVARVTEQRIAEPRRV